MIQTSLINCVEVLYAEKLVTKREKDRLIEGVISGNKRAYEVVSYKLQKLALNIHKESFNIEAK